MKIWIIKTGEPVPGFSTGRTMRSGLLANYLAKQGHDVTWWTSTFDHQEKRYIPNLCEPTSHGKNLTLWPLHSDTPYTANISIKRLKNHQETAYDFDRKAKLCSTPDCIIACLPTIDLAASAVKFGKQISKPTIIDIRDAWPTIFESIAPRTTKWIVRRLLYRQYKNAKYALKNATVRVAISNEYLDWSQNFAGSEPNQITTVIPIGFKSPHSTRKRFDQSPTRVFFSGTFGYSYDIKTILDAAQLLVPHRDIKFVLAGNGEKVDQVIQRSKSLRNIEYKGWLSQDELALELNKCTIGLSAYSKNATQSIPNKPIEYLAHGIPQICSLNGEMRSLLEENKAGLYYEPENPESLAETITRLTQNRPLLHDMSKASKNLFVKNFELDNTHKSFLKLITSITN